MQRSRSPRGQRPYLTALALMLIFGLAGWFRVCDLAGRNLWTDEAWVALAALQPTPAAALATGQSTPPFYLLTVWAAAQLLGGSELVLRSLSFLLGMGTLLLFWPFSRPLATLPASLLALAAVGFSPVMVYYAKELKQYSGDAFFALLIFFLTERLRAHRGARGWAALTLTGAIGLGYSHTLIFILPVAGAVLWFALPPGLRPRLAIVGGVWALTATAYYLLFVRPHMDPDLVAYWTQDFPDFSGLRPFLVWLGPALYRYFWYFLGEWGVYWGPPLLAAGVVAAVRRGEGRVLAYLMGPLLLTFGAAVLHRYPFMAHYGGNRLMLFSAPFLYLVAAMGAAGVFAWLWRQQWRWLAVPLAGLLFLSLHPLTNFHENLRPLHNREEIRPLISYLEQHRRPQDLIYVYYHAITPFKYYYQGPKSRLCWGKSCVEAGLETAAASPPRIWLIASHIPDVDHMRRFAADLLGPHWRETACLTQEGAVLFRFDPLEPAAPAKTPAPPPAPPLSAAPTPQSDTAYK